MAEAQHQPLAGMAMNLALAITMVIPCPFVGAVTDGGVDRVAVPIARPFVCVESRAVRRAVLGDQAGAGARVRIIAAPSMQLAHLARADAERGGTIVDIGTVPWALMGALA